MKGLILFIIVFFATLTAQAKPIELVFWHGMAGELGDALRDMVDDFNHSQNEYTVKAAYKGNYIETLTSFAAAFRAHRPPAVVQIYEVGTAMMIEPKGVIKPVDVLMRENNLSLPKEDFIQAVRDFYSRDGQLVAMPFNLSVPILYYNSDAVAKVGYTHNNFPKTWDELEILANKLQLAGFDCIYTTAYPGWILFESYLALHGLPITQTNPPQVVFNTPQLERHFKRLKRWQSLHYFRYGGRADDATILFTSGLCPMFSQSSGVFNSLQSMVSFHVGVATMPLDTGVSQQRYANVAGGAALWAVAGLTKEQYTGIARFFTFIARADVQKKWHERTGYLPLGFKGVYAHIVESSKQPSLLMARTDLDADFVSKHPKNIGPQNQIRIVNDEALEALFAGLLNSHEALQLATARSNHALLRFVRNTRKKN